MKRAHLLFNQITDYENIRLAWLKARKGKSSKAVVRNFSKDVNANLLKVQKNLKAKPPILSKYTQFKIFDPKERIISVVPFIDRVMHHAIMNVLEAVFERQFIYHTYACRKGKGSHRAVKYAFRMVKTNQYFLKLDIKKYFDNISHVKLKRRLSRIIKDKDCLRLLFSLIDSYGNCDCSKGLPIGNLTSQFFANYYLSELDHYVLEILKPTGYVRYMDDFVLFDNSKERLKEFLQKIQIFCGQRLFLNLNPYVLGKCKDGLVYLGNFVNKENVKLSQKSLKRKRRKLKRINFEYENQIIQEDKYLSRVKCLFA